MVTSLKSFLYHSKKLAAYVKDVLAASQNMSLNLGIRPAPVYLSANKRIRRINTYPGDNPKNIQPSIYDLMSLYNSNPISGTTLAQREQQGGVSGHIDNQ